MSLPLLSFLVGSISGLIAFCLLGAGLQRRILLQNPLLGPDDLDKEADFRLLQSAKTVVIYSLVPAILDLVLSVVEKPTISKILLGSLLSGRTQIENKFSLALWFGIFLGGLAGFTLGQCFALRHHSGGRGRRITLIRFPKLGKR